MKIPCRFATYVTMSVPVIVSGTFNEDGEFCVDEITQMGRQSDDDVAGMLSAADMEEIIDKAKSYYYESCSEFEREMKAEGRFRRAAEDVS